MLKTIIMHVLALTLDFNTLRLFFHCKSANPRKVTVVHIQSFWNWFTGRQLYIYNSHNNLREDDGCRYVTPCIHIYFIFQNS